MENVPSYAILPSSILPSFFYLVSAFWDVYLIVSVFGVQYKYQLFFHKSTPSTSSNGAHSGWSSAVFNKNFSLQPSLQSTAFSSATPVGSVNLHNSFAQSSWVGSVNSQLIRSIFSSTMSAHNVYFYQHEIDFHSLLTRCWCCSFVRCKNLLLISFNSSTFYSSALMPCRNEITFLWNVENCSFKWSTS